MKKEDKFESETSVVAEILQNCFTEGRYLKRSEINELNNYLTKHEKIESRRKEIISEIYSDFSLSYTHLKESNSDEVMEYLKKMSGKLSEAMNN